MSNLVRNFTTTGTDGVEPGIYTTEFWVTAGTALLSGALVTAADFGLPLTLTQKTDLIGLYVVAVPVLAAVYSIVRTWRKNAATTPPVVGQVVPVRVEPPVPVNPPAVP